MRISKFKLFQARYFSIVIGLFVFLLVVGIKDFGLIHGPQTMFLDLQMQLRNTFHAQSEVQGASYFQTNNNVSPDILLVGVDTNSLNNFGRWPWPRYRHADFLNFIARISNQNQRESSVMLDFFFFDGSSDAGNDVALINAIEENKRVFLEGTLIDSLGSLSEDESVVSSFEYLMTTRGSIKNVQGDTSRMRPFYGMETPTIPISANIAGYGHATFTEGEGKLFRNQILVAKVSRLQEVYSIDDIAYNDLNSYDIVNKRLAWFDKEGTDHTIPVLESEDSFSKYIGNIKANSPVSLQDIDGDGSPEEYYLVYSFEEFYVPSITLSLALKYFGLTYSDIEVEVGSKITIKNPSVFDSSTGRRKPFTDKMGTIIPEIHVPIDEQASLLINFMGVRTDEPGGSSFTYNIRPYIGYSQPSSDDPSTWNPTVGLENKIVLAGAFSPGMADDEKNTPVGPMYGVEVHANALNTIITNNFIWGLPDYLIALLIFSLIFLITYLSAKLSPIFSLLAVLFLTFVLFWVSLLSFEYWSLSLDVFLPSSAMILTSVLIISYRVMTEEKEKKRIRSMFGKYVSPAVVDQMIKVSSEPELGGVDKEITVLFSDIRGFTTLSESMSPQELVNHLNLYLTAMTDIIHEFQGTLDKYVGDEIMCFWGAPLSQTDHALLACKCAIKQMAKLKELNDSWSPERRFDIGIGLNSGIMTVGNMGSIGRMNYTLMGDNVNLGARLEGTNKQYLTNIIISEYTYNLVKDKVVVRELDNIRVKGKNKPVQIYELIDIL